MDWYRTSVGGFWQRDQTWDASCIGDLYSNSIPGFCVNLNFKAWSHKMNSSILTCYGSFLVFKLLFLNPSKQVICITSSFCTADIALPCQRIISRSLFPCLIFKCENLNFWPTKVLWVVTSTWYLCSMQPFPAVNICLYAAPFFSFRLQYPITFDHYNQSFSVQLTCTDNIK